MCVGGREQGGSQQAQNEEGSYYIPWEKPASMNVICIHVPWLWHYVM